MKLTIFGYEKEALTGECTNGDTLLWDKGQATTFAPMNSDPPKSPPHSSCLKGRMPDRSLLLELIRDPKTTCLPVHAEEGETTIRVCAEARTSCARRH